MGTETSRREKIAWFMDKLNMLKIRREKADLNSLLATFAIDRNSTRQTGMQILRDLNDSGKIHIKADEVWLK